MNYFKVTSKGVEANLLQFVKIVLFEVNYVKILVTRKNILLTNVLLSFEKHAVDFN